jgi:hypothetical protein
VGISRRQTRRGKQGRNGNSLFIIQNRMKNDAIPSFSKGRSAICSPWHCTCYASQCLSRLLTFSDSGTGVPEQKLKKQIQKKRLQPKANKNILREDLPK